MLLRLYRGANIKAVLLHEALLRPVQVIYYFTTLLARVGRWQSDHPAFAKGVVLRFVGEGNTPSHTKVYLIYYFAAAKGVILRFIGEGNTPSHMSM